MKLSSSPEAIRNLLARIFVAAVFLVALAGATQAQQVTIVHSFGDWSLASDGTAPVGSFIQGTNGALYGTTSQGGGCAFVTSPQGSIIYLHRFGNEGLTNDGLNPVAGLIHATDGNYYGTTSAGGSAGEGTVFRMNSLGGITILHSFGDGSVAHDGSAPLATLFEASDGILYGTTSTGGSAGKGTVFAMTLQGGAVTTVHSFGDGTVTNDGATPQVGLTQDAQGNLYGTTYAGGSANQGTVYVLNTQRQETVLYSFSQASAVSFSLGSSYSATGAGGFYPNSRLLLATDGNLYGTTSASAYGYGAIYKITTQGQESVLHYFCDGTVSNDGRETAQGENALIQTSDGTIYGTTSNGGAAEKGTIFAMSLQGAVTILHSFSDGTVANDGANPEGGILLDANGDFYGMTSAGGSAGTGTIFQMAPSLPMITSALSAEGAVGLAFSYQTTATHPTNADPQIANAFSATGLPDGLSINGTTGLISGSPTATGTSDVTLTVTNPAGSTSVTLVIAIIPAPVITSILSEFGSTAAIFNYQITASSNPRSFAATGLPAGLMINATTGVIYGAPTATGTFPVSLSATNLAGTDTETLTLTITGTAPTLSQEYVLLRSFNDGSVANEGSYAGAIIQGLDQTLYGVTGQGGANASGTICNLSAAGGAGVLTALGGANGSHPMGLVQATDGSFYGTAHDGGSANVGTIFKVSPAGVVTLLHTFGDGTVTNDGANPQAGLILAADGNYYGTTQSGGSANLGTIFEMTPAGVVTILHSFGDGSVANDGAQPVAALVQVGGVFYGTTLAGGSASDGTVFSMSATGTVTILHHFGDGSVVNDGQMPHAALTPSPTSATTLYGTTVVGGTLSKGTIFQITTAGVETVLHNFDDGSVANDGVNPMGPLLAVVRPLLGLTLYGTTQSGGTADTNAGFGTIFQLNASNVLTIIHSFGDGSVTDDGQTPLAGLCLGADGNLYGTTVAGGAGYGTAFAVVANLNPPASEVFSGGASPWSFSGTLPQGLTFDPTTGAILGTPSVGNAIGMYKVSVTSPQNVTTTLTYALTQNFAQWASTMSTSNVGTAMPRNDGVPNLLKYVYDIDPNSPLSAADRMAMPTVGMTSRNGSDYLTLTYRQYAALGGVSIVVQTSTDMVTWTSVYSPDISAQVGTDATTGDPIMQVGVKTTEAKQFIRLNVAAP